MRWQRRGGLDLLAFEGLGGGVEAMVTCRIGGVSAGPYRSLNLGDHVGDDPKAVRANRDAVCRALGVQRLTIGDQRHGAGVAVVDTRLDGAGHASGEDARARLPATDGLVTAVPGIALAVLVADCLPVVLWDHRRRALGVAHAGRRGALAGVVAAIVGVMQRGFGSRPADLRVGIGPHIGARSYEVGPAEVAEVRAAFPDLECQAPTREGRATVDLASIVRRQLRDAGVGTDAVEHAGIDTLGATDRFFSDRERRPCGRFALVAHITGA